MDFVDDFEFGDLINGILKAAGIEGVVIFVLGDDTLAEGVVGVNIDMARFGANEAEEAGAHIGGAVFGEGETEDVFGSGVGVGEDVGDLAREKLGFAGAGASEDEEGAVEIFNSFFLEVVELDFRHFGSLRWF